MRARVLILLFFAGSVLLHAQSQYALFSCSDLADLAGNKMASGTITLSPVLTPGSTAPAHPHLTHGGRGIATSITFQVTNGVCSAIAGTMQLVDVTQANPANFCYATAVHDNNSGETWYPDSCLQPSYNASWCSVNGSGQTICNYDNYIPTGTPGALQVAGAPGPNCATNSPPGECDLTSVKAAQVSAPTFCLAGSCITAWSGGGSQTQQAAVPPTFSLASPYTGATTSVALSDASPGAAISYCLDATNTCTPNQVYASALNVNTSGYIRASATAPGLQASSVTSFQATITVAASPTFSPPSPYTGPATSVTIVYGTWPGALAFYCADTTNTCTPTTQYSGPIFVSSTGFIGAIDIGTGLNASPEAVWQGTITGGTEPAPAFAPPAGTYTATQNVTITASNPGSSQNLGSPQIFYTTDGTTPVCGSPSVAYTAPVAIAASETLAAITCATGFTSSSVTSGAYTINTGATQVATPAFSPLGGTYQWPVNLTLSDSTSGSSIYWAVTSAPGQPSAANPSCSGSGTLYTGSISTGFAPAEGITAIGCKSGMADSALATSSYTVTMPAPTFSPTSPYTGAPTTVTISDAASGAPILYCIDTTNTCSPATTYTAPIGVASSEYIRAYAGGGLLISNVSSWQGSVGQQAANPTFSPASPYNGAATTVALSDTTPGATILYCTDTTNSCTPTTTYTAPISEVTPGVSYIRAVASASGFATSFLVAWQGAIVQQTAAPTFSPLSPYNGGPTSVTISDSTPSATIFYCVDSTNTCVPTITYSAPISVAATEFIRADATPGTSGWTVSVVASWQGTIQLVAAPTFIPVSPYSGDVTRVTLSDATGGASILYCTEALGASTQCTPTTTYTSQINVTASTQINAVATVSGFTSAQSSWMGTIGAGTLTTYSDNLSQANGPLSSNWSQVVGAGCSLTVVSHMAESSGGACGHNSMAAYTGGTFDNNQWSSIVYGNVTASPVGYDTLVVRSSGSSTYNDAYSGYSASYAVGIVNPSPSDFDLAVGTVAPAVGNTVELDVAGTGPVFFWSRVNGNINLCALDTTYNYIGGFPGFGVVEMNSTPTATVGAWSGGSLPPFSGTPSDNFTRANAGWLGDNWWFPWDGDEGGGWIISGNKAVPALASMSAWGMSIWTSPLGANPWSQITVGGFGTWLGPITRYTPQATNADSMYGALINGGSVKLYARSGGTWNLLTSWSYTPTPGDTVEIHATGTNPVALTVKVNGTVKGTYSDSVYHLAGQYAGFTALGSNASTVSNWNGGTD